MTLQGLMKPMGRSFTSIIRSCVSTVQTAYNGFLALVILTELSVSRIKARGAKGLFALLKAE